MHQTGRVQEFVQDDTFEILERDAVALDRVEDSGKRLFAQLDAAADGLGANGVPRLEDVAEQPLAVEERARADDGLVGPGVTATGNRRRSGIVIEGPVS